MLGNWFKTSLLMAAVVALFGVVGAALGGAQGLPMAPAEQHPETAQMMMINPLSAGGIAGLFSTHPATRERIARLMALAR